MRQSTRTATTAAETLRRLAESQLAAATTIAARVPMIAAAAPDPSRLADPELSRMVIEKLDAAATVAAATTPRLLTQPAVHAARWFNDHATLFARAAPLSPDAWWSYWQHLAQGAVLANAAYGAAMLGSMVQLGSIALKPVHAAVTANARRLGRK